MAVEHKENVQSATKVKTFEEVIDFKASSWGYRHQQSVILFFTLTIAYSMRACMGVALVAMTHDQNVTEHTTNSTEAFQVHGVLNAMMLTPPYPTITWSKKAQDAVLSSFYWGYMTLQIPAGQLAHRFGAKYMITGAMLINTVIQLILPAASYYGGWICTVIFRIVQGFSQACIVPGMHTMFGKWAPIEERGRLAAFAYGGQALGTVLGLPITGFISTSPLGWPGIFRFYAVLSGIICAVLWWLTADTPALHPKISYAERKYIEEGTGQMRQDKKALPVPWSKILTSRGVYATVIAHIGQTWGQVMLFSELPAFMDHIIGVDIKTNGLLIALPFLLMWFTNFFFCWLTDMLIVKKYLTITATRKLANSLASVPSAIGLIALAYVPKNIYFVESALIVICTFKTAGHSGFQINAIDLSPNFAGTIMSLSNFAANAVASLAPLVAGFILSDVRSEYLWRQVFFVTAGFYFFTNLCYVIFGTCEKAEWNDPNEKHQDVEDNAREPMIEKDNNSKH